MKESKKKWTLKEHRERVVVLYAADKRVPLLVAFAAVRTPPPNNLPPYVAVDNIAYTMDLVPGCMLEQLIAEAWGLA